jgi:uncharacterized membrane protein
MEWLKKNWVILVLVVIMIAIGSGWVDSCNSNKDYEDKIRKLKEDNKKLEEVKNAAEKRAKKAMDESIISKNNALEKEKKITEFE